MPIFKYEAEHITRQTAVKLVRELEGKGVEVEYANMDPMFENSMVLIATADNNVAGSIRARIWELNNGLCCDMHTITQAQLNAYY